MKNIKLKLIQAYKEGKFFEVISKEYHKNRIILGKTIVSLHNKNEIDVVEEFLELSNNSEAYNFFTVRHAFEEALPEIKSPLLSVMKCVKHLIEEAGNDLAATHVLNSFILYCEKDIELPKEAIQLIENQPDEWIEFTIPVIIAGTNLNLSEFIDSAVKLCKNENISIRQQVTVGLGRINYDDKTEQIKHSLEILKNILLDEDDEIIIGNAIQSLFSLYLADNSLEEEITNLIKKYKKNKSRQICYSISKLFGLKTDKIPLNLIDVITDSLKTVQANEYGIIENIDFGIRHLLKSKHIDKGIDLLEELLTQNDNELSIKVFKSTISEIYNNETLLNRIVTRWFLSRKLTLCKAVADIFHFGNSDFKAIGLASIELKNNNKDSYTYLARKAIGWLYTRPVSCISFILSMVDYISDDLNEITNLMVNPMIISYPGQINEYLEKVKPNSTAQRKKVINAVIKKWKSYLDEIKSVDELPELWISEHHKDTFKRMYSKEMEKAFKESEKKSFIHQFFPKSILLYGRASIFFSVGQDGKKHRQEIPLQNIGHAMEYPRLQNIDPQGLDFKLRIFRIERCII